MVLFCGFFFVFVDLLIFENDLFVFLGWSVIYFIIIFIFFMFKKLFVNVGNEERVKKMGIYS